MRLFSSPFARFRWLATVHKQARLGLFVSAVLVGVYQSEAAGHAFRQLDAMSASAAGSSWEITLSQPDAYAGARLPETLALAGQSLPWLNLEQRADLRQRVGVVAELAGPEVADPLLDLMYELELPGSSRAAVAARLAANPDRLSVPALAAVLEHLRADERQWERYEDLRDDALRRMSATPDAFRNSKHREQWLKVASIIGYDLPRAPRGGLGAVLQNQAYSASNLESLSPTEMYYLVRGLTGTGTPYDEINAILLSWLEVSDAWQTAELRDLEEYVDRLKRGVEGERVKLWRERLAESMLDRFLLAEGYLTSGFADAEVIADAVRTTGRTWPPSRAADLARAYYDALLIERPARAGPPTLAELESLGKLLHNAGLDRSDVVPTAYAEAILAAFQRGERLSGHPLWPAKFLASPMQAEVLRERLWQAVKQPDGSANIDLGVIAGFTFRLANTSDEWVARCQTQANKLGGSTDARSSWLLMIALAHQIEAVQWRVLEGVPLMREAVAAARGPRAKAEAAAFLASRLVHQYPGLGNQALEVLDGNADAFRQAGQLERLAQLRTDARFWQRVADQREARLAGWLTKLIEERLADLRRRVLDAKPEDAKLMRSSIGMLEDAHDALHNRN